MPVRDPDSLFTRVPFPPLLPRQAFATHPPPNPTPSATRLASTMATYSTLSCTFKEIEDLKYIGEALGGVVVVGPAGAAGSGNPNPPEHEVSWALLVLVRLLFLDNTRPLHRPLVQLLAKRAPGAALASATRAALHLHRVRRPPSSRAARRRPHIIPSEGTAAPSSTEQDYSKADEYLYVNP